MPRSFRWLPVVFALLASSLATAEPPDWAELGGAETVLVQTTDEDGDTRETTVWIVVVDGEAYVRTGSTTWGENVVRSPELGLRIGEDIHPMRVEFVEDDALRQRIADAFREKYGVADWGLSWIRGSRPKIMQLHPRDRG